MSCFISARCAVRTAVSALSVAFAILIGPLFFVLLTLALTVSCERNSKFGVPDPYDDDEYGMIEIRARLAGPSLAKSAAIAATVAEKLVIEVTGDGIASPVRIEQKVDFSRPSVCDTVTKVPFGKNRRVEIWAVDKNGVKTHIDTLEFRTMNIERGIVTPVAATLIPAAGSIYLQINGLPTTVDAVQATFTALDGGALIAQSAVKRASRVFMSLDNIPHMTMGVLVVAIVDKDGDTTYVANSELTFNARTDNVIDLQFVLNSGVFEVDLVIRAPGVTTGTYDFGKMESTVVETGELVITEIMWSAGDDNYIELYNPADDAASFDTLTTDVDGTARDFLNVTVEANGYFVIGRREQPYFDAYTAATGGLPITTTGNWITVKRGKNGAIIDRVMCAGSNAATGWPSVSGKRAIELSRDRYSAAENNFGKYWAASSQLIDGESSSYGTPGH